MADELDERLTTAIRFATRNRIEAFLRLFETHRHHEGFRFIDEPARRELGFSCCDERVMINLSTLREALPEVRASFLRVRGHLKRMGQADTRRKFQRARKRSKALLCRFLTKEQRWSLRARGWFEMVGQDGQVYELRKGAVYRGNRGFCMHEKGEKCLPTYDTMLAQMLYIEADLAGFLEIANSYEVKPKGSRPSQEDIDAVCARIAPLMEGLTDEALNNPEPFVREALR